MIDRGFFRFDGSGRIGGVLADLRNGITISSVEIPVDSRNFIAGNRRKWCAPRQG
jgi:hypothetical protein